jgi:hypothetical protein
MDDGKTYQEISEFLGCGYGESFYEQVEKLNEYVNI